MTLFLMDEIRKIATETIIPFIIKKLSTFQKNR